jgi:ATP/maltotriose-dependent transcriptional regulator MalT
MDESNFIAAFPDAELAPGRVGLSARERAVLLLIGRGFSNKAIARELGIAPETVKSHAKRIFWKLTVRSRTEAVYRAATQGLI